MHELRRALSLADERNANLQQELEETKLQQMSTVDNLIESKQRESKARQRETELLEREAELQAELIEWETRSLEPIEQECEDLRDEIQDHLENHSITVDSMAEGMSKLAGIASAQQLNVSDLEAFIEKHGLTSDAATTEFEELRKIIAERTPIGHVFTETDKATKTSFASDHFHPGSLYSCSACVKEISLDKRAKKKHSRESGACRLACEHSVDDGYLYE